MDTTVQLARPLPRRGAHRRLKWTGWLLFLPFAVVFAATVILPLGYAVGLSLFRSQFIGGVQFAGLANYLTALTDPALLCRPRPRDSLHADPDPGHPGARSGRRRWLWTAVDLRSRVSSASASSSLTRFPTVVAALMWGYMYGDQFGLIAQAADALNVPAPDMLSPELIIPAMANISVWQFTGYNMLIFYAALQSIPRELYEAAAIDGAGEFRNAWSIKLPALVPAILLATFFSAIGGIQLFTEPSILQSLAPTTIVSDYTPALYMYNLAVKGSRYEYSAAIAVTLGVATILLVLLAQVVVARRARRAL